MAQKFGVETDVDAPNAFTSEVDTLVNLTSLVPAFMSSNQGPLSRTATDFSELGPLLRYSSSADASCFLLFITDNDNNSHSALWLSIAAAKCGLSSKRSVTVLCLQLMD